MINDPSCPVCDANEWAVIGRRTYRNLDISSSHPDIQKRLRVLFEVWHPAQTEVENQSLLCERCGFVIYSPRPTADEIDRKYRFLTSLEEDESRQEMTAEREAVRADRLWNKMARYARREGTRVLDFGGGDGRLVVPFAKNGCGCFVVDYVPHPIEPITRLGTTLEDVNDSEMFDIIVCSHVIEHVAAPYETLLQLGQHLREGGAIYIEVPMEIWKQPPLHEEPVTHVNFFTVDSLRTLIQRAGWTPVSVKLEDYPHPLGHHTVVVSAIAENLPSRPPEVQYRGATGTRALLNPSLAKRLQRVFLRPGDLPKVAWQQVRRRVIR